MRAALLSEAARLLQQRGRTGFSMREVAKRASVSSGAPYRHFADNAALLDALAVDVRARFMRRVASQLDGLTDDPLERLKAYGLALVRFAASEPDHYRLMTQSDVFARPAAGSSDNDVLTQMRADLRLAMSTGRIRLVDPVVLALTLQAVAHGIAHMVCEGMLARLGIDDADAVERTALAIMRLVDRGFVPQSSSTPGDL